MGMTWEELDALRPKDKTWKLPLPPTCPHCDYFLIGLKETRCPECGQNFHWDNVRQRTQRIWSIAKKLKHANRDSTVGLLCSGSGWAILSLFSLMDWRNPIINFGLFLMAVTGIGLGTQVLNVRLVPKWAHVCFGQDVPRLWIGVTAITLGVLLIVGLILLR